MGRGEARDRYLSKGGLIVDQGLVTVIGMSIAYAASFLGMALAWYGWRKRHGREEER